MTAPKTTTYVYDGPIEVVEVSLPSGRTVTVARGETVDALPSEAEALDRAEGFKPTTKPAAQAAEKKEIAP